MKDAMKPLYDGEAEKSYEDGKHRRYTLLFAVNGGAFAIAKLMVEPPKGSQAIGGLTLRLLAIGMMVFTGLMTFDIGAFGCRMRKRDANLFAWPGLVVLVLLGLLLCSGWLLVGCLG